MKAKKGDLLVLWHVLEGMKHKKQNVKFSYFVAKNKIAIKQEVDALNEVSEASDAFKLYDTKRADLAAELADKLPDGVTPMTNNGQYVIKEKKEEFDKKLAELKEEFGASVKEREDQIKAFKDILEEEVEFKGHGIKIENLPSDVEPSVMEALLNTDLIIEDE
jgi:ADP-heptose:LPS heptosyltransferase